MNNFSAFKLFYEEFIYKKNIMVNYDLIDNNINNIKKILFEINDLNKDDENIYLKKIEKYNKSIKKELDNIMNIYPYFYELYYVLYKRNIDSCDEVKDMPLVISCSFYNDFTDMKKSYISRYSSKEKREFRNDGKKLGYINFFISVLKNRKKDYLNLLIDELTEFTNKKIDMKSSFQEVKNSFSAMYKSINNQLKRCIYNAKLSDDYIIIKDIMEIAFKDRITSVEEFNSKLDDYLLSKYENLLSNSTYSLSNLSYNYISYKEYKKIIKEERRAKNKYDEEFKKNGNIDYEESSYFNEFRKSVITSYYDNRQLDPKRFKDLSSDLVEWLFTYKKFLAMYSINFQRNNTIRYALINGIYELYTPYKIYDIVKSKYAKEINKNIKNRLRDFFITNYKENLNSKTDKYDTREYDMNIILDVFNIDELLDIYNSLLPTEEEKEKLILLFSKRIANCIGNSNPTEENIYDIASKYLNTNLVEVRNKDIDDIENYNIIYESYRMDKSNENEEKLQDSFNNLDLYNKRKILLEEILDVCLKIESICYKKKIDITKLKSDYVIKNKNKLDEKDYYELNYIYLIYLKEDLSLLLEYL